MDNFEKFVKTLKQEAKCNVSTEGLTSGEKEFVGSVYNSVIDFVEQNRIVPAESLESLHNFSSPLKSLSTEAMLTDIGTDSVLDLCRQASIPENKMYEAAKTVALLISQYSGGGISNSYFHDGVSLESFDSRVRMKSLDSMYSSKEVASHFMTPDALKISMESYGVNMDNIYLDAKLAMTISLLQFHRSIMTRFLPVKAVNSDVATFKTEKLEVYNLEKAMSSDAKDRYRGSHRMPFIDLYSNPEVVNTTPPKIIPLDSNDGEDKYLFQDGIVKVGVEANLFDLSMIPTQLGYDRVDYTDLVSEGGKIKQVVLKVVDNDDTSNPVVEYVPVDISFVTGARFTFPTNAADSADRVNNIEEPVALDNSTLLLQGTASTGLAFLNDGNHYVRIVIHLSGKINLKSSYINEQGTVSAELKTKDGTAPTGDMAATYAKREFSLIGYEPEVYFNTENLRKVSAGLRIQVQPYAYNIPVSKPVVVDYALDQAPPEVVINALTQYLAIGNDDRGVQLILDNIQYVANRIAQESGNSTLLDNYAYGSLINEFVAGHLAKPSVVQTSIDISSNLANIRSGDEWGDLRAVVERYLVDIINKLMNMSFYDKQLDKGEQLNFNVLTSAYIKNSLLSVPLYHQAFDQGTTNNPNDVVEFRRELPGGTILNVITTNFNYMADKILMVPVRPTRPDSVLNYGFYVNRGTFVSTLTPSVPGGSSFKRIVSSSRSIPIITCPVGVIVQIQKLSSVFNGVGSLGME